MSNEPNEIFFNFFDIVRLDGYWPRVFRVEGYHIDNWRYPNEQWTDMVYELTDVYSGEFLEADVEDLTLVETADKAEEYLRNNPAPVQPKHFAIDVSHLMKGAETMAKEERKPTAREISAQIAEERKAARKAKAEQIDNLLDMRNWASEMLAKTNDEAYGERVIAIDAELKTLTESE